MARFRGMKRGIPPVSNLFIPTRIRVGFVNRADTYTQRLAYVIYYDAAGKLRKSASWESWRDKSIEPVEHDNVPTEGFCLNKNVQRYNWSHFGSNRSYIRMYDPRGVEFEVTPENLIGILTETNCNKRGLDGAFVYAWDGKDLVLLPCNSEAYREATKHTARQSMKISAKDLLAGRSYTTKDGSEVVYLGRFKWYGFQSNYNNGYNSSRTAKRYHIFRTAQGGYELKSDTKFLASLNNPDPVPNYAELMEEYNRRIESSPTVSWEVTPTAVDLSYESNQSGYHLRMNKSRYFFNQTDTITVYAVEVLTKPKQVGLTYKITEVGTINKKDGSSYRSNSYSSNYNYNRSTSELTEEQALARLKDAVDVTMVLENGSRIPLTESYGCLY